MNRALRLEERRRIYRLVVRETRDGDGDGVLEGS